MWQQQCRPVKESDNMLAGWRNQIYVLLPAVFAYTKRNFLFKQFLVITLHVLFIL